MATHLRREDLKRNELGEAVQAGVHYAEDHLRTILWAVGGVVAAGLLVWGGVAWSGSRSSRSNEALGRAIAVAQASIVDTGARPDDPNEPSFPSAAARDARAKELFTEVVAKHGSSAAGSAARLWLADAAFAAGDSAEARRQWQAYLDAAPGGAFVAVVRRNLWALDRSEGKGEEALRGIQRDLERGGKELPSDVLLWELSQTERALGHDTEATAALRRLTEEHPDSPYADEARRGLAKGAA